VSDLAALYAEYGRQLYRYALFLMADPDAAEDVLQESFCRLADSLRRGKGVASPEYLNRIVRNECYSLLRRRRRAPTGQTQILEPADPGVGRDQQLVIEDALRRLPTEQREVVYLKVYEGLSFREIGERCGISFNTAASRYRYALEALRGALEPFRSGT
jgi:RNA polymerase sigma-70 factor, ECF subfamily